MDINRINREKIDKNRIIQIKMDKNRIIRRKNGQTSQNSWIKWTKIAKFVEKIDKNRIIITMKMTKIL